jgi:hypothetical protein
MLRLHRRRRGHHLCLTMEGLLSISSVRRSMVLPSTTPIGVTLLLIFFSMQILIGSPFFFGPTLSACASTKVIQYSDPWVSRRGFWTQFLFVVYEGQDFRGARDSKSDTWRAAAHKTWVRRVSYYINQKCTRQCTWFNFQSSFFKVHQWCFFQNFKIFFSMCIIIKELWQRTCFKNTQIFDGSLCLNNYFDFITYKGLCDEWGLLNQLHNMEIIS